MTEYRHPDRADDAGDTFRRWAESDRHEISRARQAAEALFVPKREVAKPSTQAAVISVDQTARKPRILSAVRVRPARVETIEASVDRTPPEPHEKISASQVGRIRTWLKYGMTIPEVAKVYGVTVGDIERVLQRA
jgi:hypothetical protein